MNYLLKLIRNLYFYAADTNTHPLNYPVDYFKAIDNMADSLHPAIISIIHSSDPILIAKKVIQFPDC